MFLSCSTRLGETDQAHSTGWERSHTSLDPSITAIVIPLAGELVASRFEL